MANKPNAYRSESAAQYIPLRVYSVYSRGGGAVAAAELADYAAAREIPALAVSDPFCMAGWESFYRCALERGLQPLTGIEIRLRGLGAMVLFAAGREGYFNLVDVFNRRSCADLSNLVVLFVPERGSVRDARRAVQIMAAKADPGSLYLGLEWNSPRHTPQLARDAGIPLVWLEPLRWVSGADGYAACAAVFLHRSIRETRAGIGVSGGPLSSRAILRRWGDAGKAAMAGTFAAARRSGFVFASLFRPKKTDSVLLENVVRKALGRRSASGGERERAAMELRVIAGAGFAPYFLLAAEIAAYCGRQNIYFNLRGSGGACYILYLLGISRVNPLEQQLLFERFVNSLREDLPDIDIDIDSSRRQQVLDWVFSTWSGRVAFVATHKFFGARSALYEVSRACGFSPKEAQNLTADLPLFARPGDLAGRGRGRLAEIHRTASLLQGVYRERSLHVGGVVFAAAGDPGGIRRMFPVRPSAEGFDQLVWDRHTVERLNVFKLDLLGVRGFDVIAPVAVTGDTCLDDERTWEMIRRADTVGCFQLESPLARKNLRACAPRNLAELGIAIAIIRPGPARSGMKAAYTERKAPLHPLLGKIFPHTRGALIFEEQISRLLHAVTGWNLEYCEKVRRQLKKRQAGECKKDYLVRGAARGWQAGELEQIWQLAADFSLYAFNQAHSASYAYSAYLSAWFKTHRPLEFFCRLLNSGGGYYPLPFYAGAARRSGICLLPPDVNRSQTGFSMEAGKLRSGLLCVRGVGPRLAERILAARRNGFAHIEEFVARTRVSERELAALFAVSAFASMGISHLSAGELEKNWKEYLGFTPGAGSAIDNPPGVEDNSACSEQAEPVMQQQGVGQQ